MIVAGTFVHVAHSQISSAITPPATVAHVYVQTPKGVNLYNTASTGKLTLITGSPFKTIGLMVGTNGKFFFSNGTTFIHVYAMSSAGVIGKEVFNINTALYAGADCGTTGPTVLDHSGQYIYVLHNNAYDPNFGGDPCYGYQSFKISTNGQLTFIGNASGSNDRYSNAVGPMTITGNNTYAYSLYEVGYGDETIQSLKRNNGVLDLWGNVETDPAAYDSSWGWLHYGVTADPTNHLAVFLMQEQDLPFGNYAFPQLASYTVDASGNISTTNTYQNMPSPNVYPGVMNTSPSGKLLAVGSNYDYSTCACGMSNWGTSGLEVFHFNASSPITPYTATLTKTPVDSIHWDNANHLYALSYSTGKLYVFTVTPTSVTPVSGSPYTVSSPTALIVR